MKTHSMKLNPSPFEMIKTGRKTIELRLYDEKRQEISVGDNITFINTENESNIIYAEVLNIYIFESFEELYKTLPLLKCGYTEKDIDSATPDDMLMYYSEDKQKKYGVVGIEVKLI